VLKRKPKKPKKLKPKRPVAKVFQSVRQVLKISHIAESEAVWQWGEAKLEALPPSFELGVWNIWKGSGGEGFLGEYQRMVKDRHLLLFQEALLTLKGLGHFVPSGYAAHHGATYRRKDGLREGVMTVSLARTASIAQRILCLVPEPLLKTTKATLVTMYKIEGREQVLCVVNMHATLLRSPGAAARELEQVIDKIAGHEGPILYAGDFNTFSRAYIEAVDRVLLSIGLRRVVLEGDPRSATTALDQIYVRGIEIKNARIDTSFSHSDHFPIMASVEIS
jgi:endonuclease/exonuclease/phosphatase (EEP) superfamily protein YafD